MNCFDSPVTDSILLLNFKLVPRKWQYENAWGRGKQGRGPTIEKPPGADPEICSGGMIEFSPSFPSLPPILPSLQSVM